MFENLFSEHGLSLERLRTLQLVSEAGSIAAAARGDTTRQSQYSRQLKELEQFFGTTLTRRQSIMKMKKGEILCHATWGRAHCRPSPHPFLLGSWAPSETFYTYA